VENSDQKLGKIRVKVEFWYQKVGIFGKKVAKMSHLCQIFDGK